jgi:hypothetical protein
VSAKYPLSFLLLAAAANTAHADAVTDFKTGAAVKISTATVDLGDGPRSSSGSSVLAKRAGTLDFDLQASDLGAKVPIRVHLRGTAGSAGRIDYSIDQTFSPRVDLGGGHWLASVTGRLSMLALPLPGRTKQDVGDVRLAIAGPSSLVAYTDFGKITIAITKLDVLGGVVQPPLDTFADPNRTLVCSDKVATTRLLAVSLSSVARGTGAAVELKGPRDAGVRVPSGVVVHTGSRSTTLHAHIEPNFVGTVRLTATAGGIARSLDVVVHPRGDCAR